MWMVITISSSLTLIKPLMMALSSHLSVTSLSLLLMPKSLSKNLRWVPTKKFALLFLLRFRHKSCKDEEDNKLKTKKKFIWRIDLFLFPQAYEPVSDGVIAKSKWEIEKKVQQPQKQVVFCSNTSMESEITL